MARLSERPMMKTPGRRDDDVRWIIAHRPIGARPAGCQASKFECLDFPARLLIRSLTENGYSCGAHCYVALTNGRLRNNIERFVPPLRRRAADKSLRLSVSESVFEPRRKRVDARRGNSAAVESCAWAS